MVFVLVVFVSLVGVPLRGAGCILGLFNSLRPFVLAFHW